MKKEGKFQITKAELNQIIKEEYAAMVKESKKVKDIKARIQQINEELESNSLSEVEASGTKKVRSTGWTGDGNNDVKFGEKFEKIGSHLKEEDELESEIEMGVDMDTENEMGYFEAKFAELGRELDSKMGMEDNSSVEAEMEDEEEFEIEDETEEVEEIEENEEMPEAPSEEEYLKNQVFEENLEEPMEGESPAQDSNARFNDYMKKDTRVNEGTKEKSNILSEGFTSERKSALNKELERMKALAKIGK